MGAEHGTRLLRLLGAGLRINFLPVLLGMKEVPGRLRKLLDLGANSAGLRIPEPMTTEE